MSIVYVVPGLLAGGRLDRVSFRALQTHAMHLAVPRACCKQKPCPVQVIQR